MAADTFITQLLQLGVGGIDLKRAIDMVSPLRLARMTNWARNEEGKIQVRPGQRRLAWGRGVRVHSLARLQAALSGGEYVRLAGIDGTLQAGTEAQLNEIADGFSGQPLIFVPGRPALSGDSWMFIADSAKLVKVRASDLLVLPIGMRAPVQAAIAVVGSDNQTAVDSFDSTVGWVVNAGTGGAPSVAFTSEGKAGGGAVYFTTAPGAATGGYYNFWGKAQPLDLSKLSGIIGITDSEDNDLLHLWMKMDLPSIIEEIRLYFVVSDNFSTAVVPGTSTTQNTDAYVKSFIPALFTPLVELVESANTAVQSTISTRQSVESLASAETPRTSAGPITTAEQQDETRALAERRLALGRGQWTEFGAAGTPLRRGEFLRIGSDSERNWGTVTGLVVWVKTTTNQPVILHLDDCYLRGGFNLDSSEPTSIGYDWRYRHYDPRTGARSRFSPEMTTKLDLVRQNARVTPEAYGDPEVRQEFYRRGGTLPSNWYFVGINQSDGGCGKDNVLDSIAAAAGTNNDDDYHQPVSTTDRDGNPVYAQPIPVIFGPLRGIMFGLGDPYRPGHIYWTLPDEVDHWPVYANAEVCSPDEELMNGCIFGGNAWAFSRHNLFPLMVSVVDNKIQAGSSACAKGLAARYGMCVGLDGIYFVAVDGIWKTTGSTPQNLTDDFIEPIFRGITKNGYRPIDWAAASQIQLSMHANELWFQYQDVDGNRQVWIYSLIFQFWRHYNFGWPVFSVFSEEYEKSQLLLGSGTTGRIYVHEGAHDDGLAIPWVLRSGALNMGQPRVDKLFGDIELEMDLKGTPAQITTFSHQDSVQVDSRTIVPLPGPLVYLIDAFGSVPLLAKDISFELSGSSFGVSPVVGRGGPSFVPQPESSIGRITEWDNLGSPTNKIVKGILIEADTFGFEKHLQVMVDGGTAPAASFSFRAPGRQFQHIVFDSQLDAREVRLTPSDNSPWLPYELRWLFDLDPLELTKWETQPTDHGIHANQTLGEAWITIKSRSAVLLTVTAFRSAGNPSLTESVTIPSTNGLKAKVYVKLPALKGVLFKYVFESVQELEHDLIPHRLYREESKLDVWPWGGEGPVPVQPFGTDDLDIGRIVRDAEGAGLRGQRWLDTSAKVGTQ